MHFSNLLLLLPLLAPSTLAIPTNPILTRRGYPSALAPRAVCAETCGNVCYYQSTIDKAVAEGYDLYVNGETEGSNNYPHAYNNYEGFDFPVSGPYQEFPIMSNFQPYNGGSPGPDRVVFNTRGQLAGTVTHTGASGNNFVECDG